MHFRCLSLISLCLSACSHLSPETAAMPPSEASLQPEGAITRPPTQVATTTAPSRIMPPRLVRVSLEGIAMEAIIYDSRSHEAIVADQPDGPGSTWPDSRAAGEARGGLGAINAGFFTPEGAPLGLVVTNSQRRGGINRASSLGSGFYVLDSGGNPSLLRREEFRSAREAIQAGPFLVENGRQVGSLSEKASSARTFIATNGSHGWVLARTGPCSLRQLATALKGARIGEVSIKSALNLDGGRSSEIWASDRLLGGPVQIRPLWNKPVRNFLVLREK